MKSQVSAGNVQQQLSSNRFFAKHADLVDMLFGNSNRKLTSGLRQFASGKLGGAGVQESRFFAAVKQLEDSGFSRILKAAEKENAPEAFKKTLAVLLVLMDVRTPDRVFNPTRGSPGRTIEEHTLLIRSLWEKRGRPKTTNDVCAGIAKIVFPSLALAPARPKELKKKITLVRAAIKRRK